MITPLQITTTPALFAHPEALKKRIAELEVVLGQVAKFMPRKPLAGIKDDCGMKIHLAWIPQYVAIKVMKITSAC